MWHDSSVPGRASWQLCFIERHGAKSLLVQRDEPSCQCIGVPRHKEPHGPVLRRLAVHRLTPSADEAVIVDNLGGYAVSSLPE
jgi:hypothetical protein